MPTPEVLSIIVWPITVFLIVLIFMYGFRKSINHIIDRLQKTKFPGGAEAEFGSSGETIKQNSEKKYLETGKDLISDPSTKPPTSKIEAGQTQQDDTSDINEPDWFRFFTQKDYKKARELLLVELDKEKDKEKIETFKSIAANLLSHYDFNGAIKEYEKLIEDDPTNDSLYMGYAWTYLDKNLPNDAISILDRGIAKIKSAEELVLRKAEILQEYQRYDEALAIANETTNLKGKRGSKFYCLIARVQKALKEENAARSAYINAYKNDPADLEVINEIANYFLQLNDFQMEFFFRKQAVNLNGKDSNDWAVLGNCYLSLGLNNLAMQAYEEANKLANGEQAWIIANIGNLLNNLGLQSMAIKELSKSLEIDSSSQYAHERLSRAMANKDKEDQKAQDMLVISKKAVEAQVKSE